MTEIEEPGRMPRPPRGALELSLRRAGVRDRRARRRRGILAGVAIALAGLAALTLGSGGGTHRRAITAVHPGVSAPIRALPAAGTSTTDAVRRVLGYTSYVARAGHRRREVALTFDDGPGPVTPRILAILKRTRTPATFFVIGRAVRADPRAVAAEARAGFVVADHTETHPFLSRLPPADQAREIDAAAQDIHRAGAPYPQLFRPPYGSFDQATLGLLRPRHLLLVLWSADTKDFSRPGVKQITYTAISGAQPGAIILMHDGGPDRSETAAALPRIIERLRARGYRLVTVPRLLKDDPPPAGQGSPHPLSGGR